MNNEIVDLINKNQEFILTSHVNPDGDSIGSEIALRIYLKNLGKNARIINYSATPSNYTFLDKDGGIEQFDEQKHVQAIEKADVIFILDTNEYERVRTLAPYIKSSNAKKVLIDHHLGFDKNNFDYYISDTESPATGEILFRFFKNIGSKDAKAKDAKAKDAKAKDAKAKDAKDVITKDMAVALYTAIMTDTGSFKFNRTDSKTHIIAAELLGYGINPFEIYSEVYNRATIGKLHLLGRFLNNIKLKYEGKLAYSMVTQADFSETGTDEYAIEGFSSHLMSLEAVMLGIVITQTKRGVKLSFRSINDIHSNELAKEFGGGGHQNASGAFVTGADIKMLTEEVIEKSKKYIK